MKRKVTHKKGRLSFTSSINTWFQTTRLGSVFAKLQRERRSGFRGAKQQITHADRPSFSLRLPRLGSVKLEVRVLLIRTLAFAVVVGLTLIVVQLLTIKFPQSKYADPDVSPPALTGDSINILFVLYDPADRYSFVDALALLQINKRDADGLKLINISPEFGTKVTGVQSKLRSLLAVSEAEGEFGIDYLMTGVSNLLGVRVDRYIALNRDGLVSYFELLGFSYVATDKVSDPEAGVFAVNDVVQGDEMVAYLAADGGGDDAKMIRMSRFLQSVLADTFTLSGFASNYLHAQEVIGLLETNLSTGEVLELAANLFNRGEFSAVNISTREGRYVESTLGGYFAPDTIAIDQRLKQVLPRVSVIREQGRIEIFNATRIIGLAAKMQRELENQGANVIRTATSPELSETTKLYVPDLERFSANVALISEQLRGDLQIIEEPYPLNHTGDMVLVLGGVAE